MIQFNVPVKYSLLLMTGNCGPQSCFFFFSSALCWLYIFFSSFFPVTLKIKHRPSSYKCLHQNAYWLQFCGFRVLKVYPCRIGCNIRFFDHFQLPTCGGNNKCQSLKAQRKPSWHWIVVIILFPSLWNELCICLGTINGIQLDLNVAVLFSTFKLWHLKAVPLELKVKEKLYHMLHTLEKGEFQNPSIHGVQLYSWVSIFGLSESQRILPLILSVAKCHLLTILQFKLLPESCKASWYLI